MNVVALFIFLSFFFLCLISLNFFISFTLHRACTCAKYRENEWSYDALNDDIQRPLKLCINRMTKTLDFTAYFLYVWTNDKLQKTQMKKNPNKIYEDSVLATTKHTNESMRIIVNLNNFVLCSDDNNVKYFYFHSHSRIFI